MSALRKILVCTMRDEGPFVLEWLAYHYVIGFDHFVIYANDNWDQTAEILTLMQDQLGVVSYFDNSQHAIEGPRLHRDPQRRAYLRAGLLPLVRNADLIMVADADEFLNLHAGDGTLDALVRTVPYFDAMSFTWRVFGMNGVTELRDRPVIEQFTACAHADRSLDNRNMAVKTVFRPRCFDRLGVHRPRFYEHAYDGLPPLVWLNGAGENVHEYYREGKWAASQNTHGDQFGEVNHYALKSGEAFLMKRRRGSANMKDAAARLDADYLNRFDRNAEQSITIQRHLPRVRAQLADWFRLVPDLKDVHEAAFFFHKTMARKLITTRNGVDRKLIKRLNLA